MTHSLWLKIRRATSLALALLITFTSSGLPLRLLVAQEPAQPEAAKEEAAAESTESSVSASDELALSQGQLADKYTRLEELLFKMASLEAATNPRRAALLTRAVEQSKERLTKTQLETIAKLLSQKQLKRAVDGQVAASTDLKALLELLLSEDRSDRLKSEQARIKEYIKEVERLLRLQKSLQGQTEGGATPDRLAKEQGEVAERTGDLAQKIKETEEGASPSEEKPGDEQPGESKPGEEKPGEAKPGEPMPGEQKPGEGKPMSGEPMEGKPSEGKPSEGKPSEGKPMEGKPGEEKPKEPMPGEPKPGEEKPSEEKPSEEKPGEEKPGEQKPMESKPMEGESSEGKPMSGEPMEGKPSEGKPSEGKSSEGKPSEGKPSEGQPSEGKPQESQPQEQQPENPARKSLEEAQKRMQEAQKRLEEAKRNESVDEQRKAKEELEKAKAQLEEILRQLREEEIKRTLAALEARFRKMLEMQLVVYESTRRLDQLPADSRGEAFIVQCGKLAFDERKIALEAQKALAILEEEGSSVAFPASVEQMREDMDQVGNRLAETRVDDITVGIEEDIISALEEMIEALQKAQKDQEEQEQQQQQQQQQGEPEDQPLVDKIAELKMIKALQERVNKRTNRYARLLEDEEDVVGQAESADLVDALRQLSERQQEIFRITRDIVLGKNK
ncbi:hypothetical protein Psta_3227 [Pirellula staleyi DSM 6068]|uniref:Uncharacterized protein n=1 Tax=Pirellula staleyi (strain ATCC 27377 / DSM 6068 / ICPB 4128) TaxID=530564 RepID=D2QX51_PIRSD|nr:hypothetical protein [Pirellula staleyi]ADB17891.1 hypothetical protein Psta_3227 [Pirellula staleyi DSM 6068]